MQLWDCQAADPNSDQQWELTDGQLKNTFSNRCVDTISSTGTQRLYLVVCSSMVPLWQLTPEGQFQHLSSSTCLDVSGSAATANGSPVQLGPCEAPPSLLFVTPPLCAVPIASILPCNCPARTNQAFGTQSDQFWSFSPFFTISMSFFKNRVSSRCLDVPTTNIGAFLQLFDCEVGNPYSDQLWELTADGLLRNVVSNRCVHLELASGTEPWWSDRLMLGTCSGTSPRWDMLANGQLRVRPNNVRSLCVNVDGNPGTQNGLRIELQSCEVHRPMFNGVRGAFC